MFRMFYMMMILPILFCSQASTMCDLFSEVKMVEVYKDNQVLEMTSEDQQKFDELFCNAIEGARQMPAFGVSIDELTKEEIKSGLWVKFVFEKTMVKSDMPFDELLIKISKDCYGFNIIRGNNGKYDGRCFYLDLDKSMNEVYDFLDNLKIKDNSLKVELECQEEKETNIEQSANVLDDEDKNKKEGKKVVDKAQEKDDKNSVIEQKVVENGEVKNLSKAQEKIMDILE